MSDEIDCDYEDYDAIVAVAGAEGVTSGDVVEDHAKDKEAEADGRNNLLLTSLARRLKRAVRPAAEDSQVTWPKSFDLGETFHGTGAQSGSLQVFEVLSRMDAHIRLLNAPKEQWCGISDTRAFQLGADVLRERFGLGIHDLWGLLRERRLSPGETPSDLMGDIQKYVTYSLPE
ncbi:hypothetical protein FOZ62_007129, partial [Perkinsus olseni]